MNKVIKVLHIGNIANNAYLNAKILNASKKYKCDVLVADYYHIMGCPEWEDAKLDSTVNEFFPNWVNAKLNNFKRPDWFSNGPRFFAIKYLTGSRKTRIIFSFINKFFSWLITYKLLRKFTDLSLRLSLIFIFRFEFFLKKVNRQKLSKEFILSYKAHHNFFISKFPNRKKELKRSDELFFNYKQLYLYKTLFDKYDIIHCYGTDPIWPYIANFKNYVAYEHATIRKLPFDDTPLGRLVAASYSKSKHTIITNCDSDKYAKKLKCSQFSFVPHPINERWLKEDFGNSLRKKLETELNTDFILFHPPRQHWEPWRKLKKIKSYEIDPAWYKGNDIFFEGFANFCKTSKINASVICVEWGQSVKNSKKLLAELNISNRIKWIPPQSCYKMNEFIRSSDLLADQFWVGAFGSTLPKALQNNVAGMCYINERDHEWCLKELPPILNAKDPKEISFLLSKAYHNREWLQNLADKGKVWYNKYHSNNVILSKLDKIYTSII